MKPILFEFWGISIKGYGTMIAIGICAAIILLSYRCKKKGFDEDSILNMTLITIICGILGGKILFIITEYKTLLKEPMELIKNFGYGFVIYGAIIGGALAIYFYTKKKNLDVLKFLDLVIPCVALAQGFGRIGCFLAGCCYGAVTKLPIGVAFKNSLYVCDGLLRHPTQLYSSLFNFLLAAFLLWYDKNNKKDGRVFAMYLLIYGVGRYLVEFLRDDPRGTIGIFSTSQFISIFIIIIGIIIFNLEKLKKRFI